MTDTNNMKEKKGGLKPLIIALGVVAVLVVVGLCLKDTFAAWAMKMSSADKQLKYAYSKEAKDVAGSLDDEMAEANKILDEDMGVSGEISVNVSESGMGMLESYSGIEGLQELNNATINYDISKYDNVYGMIFDLLLNENELISAEMAVNYDKGLISVMIPELSDVGLSYQMEGYEEVDMENIMNIYGEVFPKEGLIETLLPKYLEIVVNEINNVEKEGSELEVAGVSQKATALTATIDGETVKNIAIAVLEEVKNDKDIEEYLETFYAELSTYESEFTNVEADTWEEASEEFYTELDNALAEIKEMDSSEFLEETITVTTWVDSKFNILAIDVNAQEAEFTAFAGKATDGKNVGCEVSAILDGDEIINLSGSGEEKGKKFTGKLTLKAQGEEYAYLDFEDFVANEDKVDGKVVISGSNALYEALGYGDFSFLNIKISLDMEATEKSFDYALGLNVSDAELITIAINGKQGKATKIDTPTNVTSDPEEWASGFDMEALMEKIKSVLPEELVGMIGEEGLMY